MFVLGGKVNGGQVYGDWPGLRNDQLYDLAELAVTTDYRRVLSEIVNKRLEYLNLDAVFPGYSGYTPLGILRGGSNSAHRPLDPITFICHWYLTRIAVRDIIRMVESF